MTEIVQKNRHRMLKGNKTHNKVILVCRREKVIIIQVFA